MGVPLKVATPGKRPTAHRDTKRRDRVRAEFLALVAESGVKPVARTYLESETFNAIMRGPGYEALIDFAKALKGGA